MDAALITSATLLGVAGIPHCAVMCAAPCAAACGGPAESVSARTWAFQLARLAGYSAAGGAAAASVGVLASLAQWSPAFRPLWALLHAGVMALGLFLIWQGRQPSWMGAIGRSPVLAGAGASAGGAWQVVHGPGRAAAAGALWVAWPCGLLQSALLVASMGNSAAVGALAMAGFALGSAAGVVAGPWLWARLGAGTVAREVMLVRAAGLVLLLGSGFALGHGLWQQVAALCGWN